MRTITRALVNSPSRLLRAGLGLFAFLIAFMLIPDMEMIPGQSIVRWLAGYGAVAAWLRVAWLEAPAIRSWWGRMSAGRRSWGGAAFVGLVFLGLSVLREYAPGPFGHFSRENGVWEPLCLLIYWGGALLLLSHVRSEDVDDRRAWMGVVGAYALLGLEEIDYFSIFGGLIGRIEGVYAGSLHDLLRLFTEGVLAWFAWVLIALALAGALLLAWRSGYLAPRFLLGLAGRREFLWLVAGLTILGVAAAEEAHLFGWVAPSPSPEEAIELVGAVCVGFYALELSKRQRPMSA